MTNKSKSDELLLNDAIVITADEVVDVIAESIPGINLPYKLAKAYLGRGMKLRQHRVLEWVEFVRDNLGYFSQELFETPEFQDCFVNLSEAYIRERAEKKRRLLQELLLSTANLSAKELEQFELERIMLTINQISFDALNVLSFISNKLMKKIESDIKSELAKYESEKGVEAKRLKDITRNRIVVSEYISNWIYQNYNLNSPTVKKKYGYSDKSPKELRHKITYEEHLKRIELTNPLPELANLGILNRRNATATFGGQVGSGYSISDYGYRIFEYLDI